MINFVIKGFGKNYFTLVSIQAYSSHARIHANLTKAKIFFQNKSEQEKDNSDDPPDEIHDFFTLININSICNCIFNKRTARVLKSIKNLCFKRCNCKFYSFRRSGSHPPFFHQLSIHARINK